MKKFDNNNKLSSKKIHLTIGIVAILALFLANTSSLNRAMALDNGGGYTLFDCSYDNDTNKETCCDNVKCLECDVDLDTGVKSNCKQVPNKSASGKDSRIPDKGFDGNMLEMKNSTKQSKGSGKFSQSLSELK